MVEFFNELINIIKITIIAAASILAMGSLALFVVTVKNLVAVVIQKIEDKFREADDRWFSR